MLYLTTLIYLFNFLGPAEKPAAPAFAPGVNKEVILKLVNDYRTKGVHFGATYYPPVPPLKWNDLLERAAQKHASDMLAKKYFSHISADGSGVAERIESVGYNWTAYAENIGVGYKNEQEVVEGWITSAGHCKNIMSSKYTEMGVARAGEYWTQNFGSRSR